MRCPCGPGCSPGSVYQSDNGPGLLKPKRRLSKRTGVTDLENGRYAADNYYGMLAYAKDGNVVCFFQSAQKFKTRYATFGFSDAANLDEGHLWPTGFALKELTATEEARISALVKKAVS